MKSTFALIVMVFLTVGTFVSQGQGGIIFQEIGFVVMPDVNSSSFNLAVEKLMDKMIDGVPITGDYTTDPTVPGIVSGTVGPENVIVGGGFDHWQAIATNPQASGETGSGLYVYGSIVGDGVTQFSLSNGFSSYLSVTFDSDDSLDAFDANPTVSPDYSGAYVGVNWGADRAPGGGDDGFFQSGADSGLIPVDLLYFAGTGVGLVPTGSGSNQENIDAVTSYLSGEDPVSVSVTVTFNDGVSNISVQDSILVSSIPEPASLALLVAAGMCLIRKRK